ncbi:hypothetical protein EDB81DRAFT_497715 [Dactylonectria macrodidyma]|uniref:Secreted protein n=1 Tax=Dactylonectria macrodidyma TaxID=307937 RepID=A0A9P9J4A3_9HYPO|nr:hypothetical protein EDB81DRAFT_497715 [Dactylonectria macrodidyma]
MSTRASLLLTLAFCRVTGQFLRVESTMMVRGRRPLRSNHPSNSPERPSLPGWCAPFSNKWCSSRNNPSQLDALRPANYLRSWLSGIVVIAPRCVLIDSHLNGNRLKSWPTYCVHGADW